MRDESEGGWDACLKSGSDSSRLSKSKNLKMEELFFILGCPPEYLVDGLIIPYFFMSAFHEGDAE